MRYAAVPQAGVDPRRGLEQDGPRAGCRHRGPSHADALRPVGRQDADARRQGQPGVHRLVELEPQRAADKVGPRRAHDVRRRRVACQLQPPVAEPRKVAGAGACAANGRAGHAQRHALAAGALAAQRHAQPVPGRQAALLGRQRDGEPVRVGPRRHGRVLQGHERDQPEEHDVNGLA